MRIEKQFIPLILSGKKKYEFRKTEDKQKVYKVGDKFYFLKLLGEIELISLLTNTRIKVFETEFTKEYLVRIRAKDKAVNDEFYGLNEIKITKEEYVWFLKHKEYIGAPNNKLPIYLYKWGKTEVETLETPEEWWEKWLK